MVKYSARHYAHPRCYLENGKALKDLHAWQIADFPALVLREFGQVDADFKFVDPAIQTKVSAELKRREEAV